VETELLDETAEPTSRTPAAFPIRLLLQDAIDAVGRDPAASALDVALDGPGFTLTADRPGGIDTRGQWGIFRARRKSPPLTWGVIEARSLSGPIGAQSSWQISCCRMAPRA
jgi:hypothetical protein